MDIILAENHYINATLKNGTIIDGDIERIFPNEFLIDDNVTGDMYIVKNDELEVINEYI